jgi:hypothetical protein
LADYAYSLKEQYNQTHGMTREQFLNLYDIGEIQLSSVFENLLVETRNKLGKKTRKVAGDRYDFVRIDSLGRETPIGDMKTGVLQKDGPRIRRFVINSVAGKKGKIYICAWNWMTGKPNFFCIPPDKWGLHPQRGYKIMVHPETGERTGGYYNLCCAHDSWESMAVA